MKLKVSTLISRLLAGLDEADVAVGDHGLDLELAVGRHDHHQLLRRRHHAADGVDGKLLHHAVDRRGELCSLVRCSALMTSWARPAAFCSALARSSSRRAPYSATVWARVSVQRGDRRRRLRSAGSSGPGAPAAGSTSSCSSCEIDQLGAELLAEQMLRMSTRSCSERDGGLELVDRSPRWWRARPPSAPSGRRVAASLAFCSAIWLASSWRCISISGRRRIGRRLEIGERIVLGQRGVQARRVELGRHQVALQMAEFGGVHGGIELDQHVARLDALAVAHMDRPHDAGLERLDDLGAAGGDDLARRRRRRCRPCPTHAQASASANTATIGAAIARPIGDGGVSTISSAAGRKASSSRRRAATRRSGTCRRTVGSADFMQACLEAVERGVAAAAS